ncbi:helix-turn-helix transcriptional regulator [Chitinophaga agrisoli]|uniref:Helix-turn-helix transcriptional regulator n=1 Tax=Chitinophaga agrisoli TaxID=2607653 RepID=A0A5B2VMY4_9BACT|nr:helix-turn-helix domain-containing protein [Chitinophaga agrisoli]KAA2239499.1 helix-turn-helix transcriptional regulator [Chitinophaga agrisoli]
MITLHSKTFTCPIDVSLHFVNGKWKILILSHLHRFEKKSFSEIRDNLPGISEKMLTQQLKQLEIDGLITKTVLSEKPYRVEYALTPLGSSFAPLYEFLSKWGITYLKENSIDYLKDQSLYK